MYVVEKVHCRHCITLAVTKELGCLFSYLSAQPRPIKLNILNVK